MFRSLKGIFALDEPVDRDEFTVYEIKINLNRSKYFSVAFFLLEILVVIISFISRGNSFFQMPAVLYLGMYVTLLATMPVFYAVFVKYEKNIAKNIKKLSAAGTLFAVFMLVWCAAISLLDQLSSGQIIIYVGSATIFAVTSYIRPTKMLIIYSTVHALFLIALPYLQHDPKSIFGNAINSTLYIALAWLISFMRYKGLIEDFNNRKKIEMQAEELNRINQELKRLSLMDSLTGVFNRFMFEAKLNEDWEECRNRSVPLALIIIDVDFFKKINDNYGHQEGDKCLKKISEILKDSVKDWTNLIARYGGDEFVILIPGMDQITVSEIAEEIRKRVEESRIPHQYSPVSEYVTISVGACSVIPSDSITITNFIKYADDALYEAKRARNSHRTAVFERIYT